MGGKVDVGLVGTQSARSLEPDAISATGGENNLAGVRTDETIINKHLESGGSSVADAVGGVVGILVGFIGSGAMVAVVFTNTSC